MRRLILCFALLWPISAPCLLLTAPVATAQAATLTPVQLTTLKAHFNTNINTVMFGGVPTMIKDLPNDGGGNTAAATWYNSLAIPDHWVWKSSLTRADCTEVTSVDGTEWSWTIYIARSQGERDAWREMFTPGIGGVATVNPSRVNVRTAIADIFSGGPGAPQRTHLLAVARRKASQVEKVFAVGVGSAASPATMGFEGAVTYSDIEAARNSP